MIIKIQAIKTKELELRLATKYEIYEDIYFRPNFVLQYDKLRNE